TARAASRCAPGSGCRTAPPGRPTSSRARRSTRRRSAARSRPGCAPSARRSCWRGHARWPQMPAEDGERSGRVYLVGARPGGAGPGDPGLLTARALELIAAADVILYDRLVGPGALAGARADAELVFVGKEGGGASVPQEQTEELMVSHARAGRTVLRLKGGDP